MKVWRQTPWTWQRSSRVANGSALRRLISIYLRTGACLFAIFKESGDTQMTVIAGCNMNQQDRFGLRRRMTGRSEASVTAETSWRSEKERQNWPWCSRSQVPPACQTHWAVLESHHQHHWITELSEDMRSRSMCQRHFLSFYIWNSFQDRHLK